MNYGYPEIKTPYVTYWTDWCGHGLYYNYLYPNDLPQEASGTRPSVSQMLVPTWMAFVAASERKD